MMWFHRKPKDGHPRSDGYIHVRWTVNVGDREYWLSQLFCDPWGDLFTYRYADNRIGFVTLNEDGTGSYCGSHVDWKRVEHAA